LWVSGALSSGKNYADGWGTMIIALGMSGFQKSELWMNIESGSLQHWSSWELEFIDPTDLCNLGGRFSQSPLMQSF